MASPAAPIQLPSQDWLCAHLDYDPSTGVLTWKTRDISEFKNFRLYRSWNSKFSGKRAGSVAVGKGGYTSRMIRIRHESGRKSYLEHRIAWKIMTGSEPPVSIDHKDHDATNNKWSNLRDGASINSRNVSKYPTNTSGVTGVSWNSRMRKWLVQVGVNGKVKRFGAFPREDLDLAAMEAMEVRAEIGFDPGHGRFLAPYREAG